MAAAKTIERETTAAWWCPFDGHSNMQLIMVCGGCGAERTGDKVKPPASFTDPNPEPDPLPPGQLTDDQIDSLSRDDLDAQLAAAGIDSTMGGSLRGGGMSADEKRAALKAGRPV